MGMLAIYIAYVTNGKLNQLNPITIKAHKLVMCNQWAKSKLLIKHSKPIKMLHVLSCILMWCWLIFNFTSTPNDKLKISILALFEGKRLTKMSTNLFVSCCLSAL